MKSDSEENYLRVSYPCVLGTHFEHRWRLTSLVFRLISAFGFGAKKGLGAWNVRQLQCDNVFGLSFLTSTYLRYERSAFDKINRALKSIRMKN